MSAAAEKPLPLITCLILKALPSGKGESVCLQTQSTHSAGLRTLFLERYNMGHRLERFEVPTNEGIYDIWHEGSSSTPNTFVARYLTGTGNPFLERGLARIRNGTVAICFRRFAHSGITGFTNNGWTTFSETSHAYSIPFKYVPFVFDYRDWREELPKHLATTHRITSLATLPKIIFYLEGMYLWKRDDVEESAQKELLARHAMTVLARMEAFEKRQHLATVLEVWDAALASY